MEFDPNALGTLAISEAQLDLMDMAENFCRDKSPIDVVRQSLGEGISDPKLWDDIVALGWLGIAIPDDYDGVGLSLAEVVPVMEQMGRRLMGTPFASTTLASQAILLGGTAAQRADILPKIVAGAPATVALSELNNDWDLQAVDAVATPTEAGYALSGQKIFVMDLDVAKYVIVSAKCQGDTALFLMSTADIPAQNRRREVIIDETRRSFALTLDGLSVPETARLDADKTRETLTHLHLCANLLSSADMVGATKACIDYTVDYLTTRKQFGKLIGSYQALKHPTVDAYVGYEKARSLLYAAAHSFQTQGQGEVATRMAKVASSTALAYAADRSIQFHGGFGFTYDCDAQLYRRRAIFHASQYGDVRYHKSKLAEILFN